MITTVEALRRVLDILAPAVPRKTALPITQNVLLLEGRALATDLTIAVEVATPWAREPILVPHRLVSEALKHVGGHTPLEVTTERGDKKAITAFRMGSTTLRLDTELPEEFPPAPETGEPLAIWEVDGGALLDAMRQVAPYTAQEDSRPVLTHVYLGLGEPAEAVGADGFRLGIKPLPFAMSAPDGLTHLLAPARALPALTLAWARADKPLPSTTGSLPVMLLARPTLRVAAYDKYISFAMGDTKVTIPRGTGAFPNYRQLVPTGPTWTLTVNAEELFAAVRSLEGVANEGAGILRFSWGSEGPLTLMVRSNETEMEASLHAAVKGDAGEIAFNVRYVSEYLKGLDALVSLEGTSPGAPAVWRHHLGPRVVMMPMFVQPGKPPATAVPQEPPAPTQAEGEAPPDEAQEEVQGEPQAQRAPEATPARRSRGRRRTEG